jgi:hypothetical protein
MVRLCLILFILYTPLFQNDVLEMRIHSSTGGKNEYLFKKAHCIWQAVT